MQLCLVEKVWTTWDIEGIQSSEYILTIIAVAVVVDKEFWHKTDPIESDHSVDYLRY